MTIHEIYSALLGVLDLSDAHRDNLLKRGLSAGQIAANGYRTLPEERTGIVQTLLIRVAGDDLEKRRQAKALLLRVPGFYERKGKQIALAGAPGMLIPVRNATGEIAAIKIRSDTASKDQRYSTLSSTGHGGPSPGAPPHFPLRSADASVEEIRFTEGELKSDVATVLSEVYTVSCAGVANWKPALKAIQALGSHTIRLSFDRDAATNATVASNKLDCARAIVDTGVALKLETWEGHNGIDDLLAAGGTPTVLAGEEAMAAIQENAVKIGAGDTADTANPDSRVSRWLRAQGVRFKAKAPDKEGRVVYVLEQCPFDPVHNGKATITEFPNGATAAKCFGGSCAGIHWAEFRDKIGGWEENRQFQSGPARYYPLPTFRPFPLEALPTVIGDLVKTAAESIGCNAAVVACHALAVVAGCVGNSRVLRLKNSWFEPSVIWSLAVADSGRSKSPAYDAAMKPLIDAQIDLVTKHKAEKEIYDAAMETWQFSPKDHRGQKPAAPVEPTRYYTSDPTIEALGTLLEDNPRGLIVARDELDAWFRSFVQYKGKSAASDRSKWLELHRAGTLLSDRRTGDRRLICVPKAAVSITGTIPSSVLANDLDTDAVQAGLGARFLMTMPPPQKRVWTEADIPEEVASRYRLLIENLLKLPLADSAKRQGHILRFSSEAKEIWIDFFNEWGEVQWNSEGEQAAAFAKIEAYAARLALIHHIVTCVVQGVDDVHSPISVESIRAAIVIARWFAAEALRVYAILHESTSERRIRHLVDWITAHGGQTTVRELQRSNSRRYRNAEEAKKDLDELEKLGVGTWSPRAKAVKGGNPAQIFTLNTVPTADTSDTCSEAEDPPSETPSDTCSEDVHKPRKSSEKIPSVGSVGCRNKNSGQKTSQEQTAANQASVGQASENQGVKHNPKMDGPTPSDTSDTSSRGENGAETETARLEAQSTAAGASHGASQESPDPSPIPPTTCDGSSPATHAGPRRPEPVWEDL
jgi:hypothetical protein